MSDPDTFTPLYWLRTASRSPRRILLAAIAISVLAHLGATVWPVRLSDNPEPLPPLAATLTELPPPPAPVTHATPPQPKAKPHRKPAPPPEDVVFAGMPPPGESIPIATGDPAPAVAATAEAEPTPVVAAAPPPTEETLPVAPADAIPPKELPPRIDLVYRGFLGTRGFFVGEAVYRLEHAANQYTISTVGEARGLAALFFRGQGKLTSSGTITAAGLQPNLYTAERTSDNRHESAAFDWETGVVLLNGEKSAGLEIPTFDPLTVLWQFYFAPPNGDEAEFNIATTRRLYHYRFRLAGTELVKLPMGNVEAQLWRRDGGEGSIDVQVWLAPSLHNVAVKARLSNGRITGEALLDSIRVDETVAQQ